MDIYLYIIHPSVCSEISLWSSIRQIRSCWRNVLFFFPLITTLSILRPILWHISCCQRSQTRVYARDLNEATYAEYLNPLTLITINSHRAIVHDRHCIFFLWATFPNSIWLECIGSTYVLTDESLLSSVACTWQNFKWWYSTNTMRYFRLNTICVCNLLWYKININIDFIIVNLI